MHYLSIHFHPISAESLSDLLVVSQMSGSSVSYVMDKALATEDEDFQVSDVSKSSDEISDLPICAVVNRSCGKITFHAPSHVNAGANYGEAAE